MKILNIKKIFTNNLNGIKKLFFKFKFKKCFPKFISLNSKGFYSVDLLFSIFFILVIITLAFSFLNGNMIQTNDELERVEGRILLSEVSNFINSLSSNGDNYSTVYKMPNTLAGNSYFILVTKNKIYLEWDYNKGQALIIPVNLVNNYGNTISKYYLYSGSNYSFKKYINNHNDTSLKIIKVSG